jgi:hypothetical protein
MPMISMINQSLAHDNPDILNRHEARYVYASIAGAIRFLMALDDRATGTNPAYATDDLSF